MMYTENLPLAASLAYFGIYNRDYAEQSLFLACYKYLRFEVVYAILNAVDKKRNLLEDFNK